VRGALAGIGVFSTRAANGRPRWPKYDNFVKIVKVFLISCRF